MGPGGGGLPYIYTHVLTSRRCGGLRPLGETPGNPTAPVWSSKTWAKNGKKKHKKVCELRDGFFKGWWFQGERNDKEKYCPCIYWNADVQVLMDFDTTKAVGSLKTRANTQRYEQISLSNDLLLAGPIRHKLASLIV